MSLQVTGQAQGLVLSTSQKSGSPSALSTGWHNELIASELLPRYGALSLSGTVFSVTYASGTVAASSATSTGPFALWNPSGSGKNLILLMASLPVITFTAGTTGAGLGFQFVANQTPTTVTAGPTPACTLVGSGNTSVAKTYTVGTLVGAPTTMAYQVGGVYLDVAAGDTLTLKDELAGAVVVAPGSGITVVMTGTLVATLIPTLLWAELAI
jgi:hypothetical protein